MSYNDLFWPTCSSWLAEAALDRSGLGGTQVGDVVAAWTLAGIDTVTNLAVCAVVVGGAFTVRVNCNKNSNCGILKRHNDFYVPWAGPNKWIKIIWSLIK